MKEETQAVVAVKYLMNLATFGSEKKFDVLGVFSDKTEEEIKDFEIGCSVALESMKDEVDKDLCMLTSFDIQRLPFEGVLSLDEVQEWVRDNCCYEWGKDWKNEHQEQRKL